MKINKNAGNRVQSALSTSIWFHTRRIEFIVFSRISTIVQWTGIYVYLKASHLREVECSWNSDCATWQICITATLLAAILNIPYSSTTSHLSLKRRFLHFMKEAWSCRVWSGPGGWEYCQFVSHSPSPQPGWYSIPGSNCIKTNTCRQDQCRQETGLGVTWSEGRRLKSEGGLVMTYRLLEDSVVLDRSRNLTATQPLLVIPSFPK